MKKIMEITVLGTLAFALLGFGVHQWQKLHLERMLPTIPWVLIIQSIFMIIGSSANGPCTLYYYFAHGPALGSPSNLEIHQRRGISPK